MPSQAWEISLLFFSQAPHDQKIIAAFQFGMPLSIAVISSMDGSSPRDSSSGRDGNSSMIVGSSFSDFAFRRLWKNLTHRSRIRTLSRKTGDNGNVFFP